MSSFFSSSNTFINDVFNSACDNFNPYPVTLMVDEFFVIPTFSCIEKLASVKSFTKACEYLLLANFISSSVKSILFLFKISSIVFLLIFKKL